MKIILANPRGFCAGVDRAIEIVRQVLKTRGAPVYVKHEVVHNRTVVNELKKLGAVFIEDIDQVPEGQTLIYSAHGVAKSVQVSSNKRNLEIFDATCPLVSKVHAEVQMHSKSGKECILIGHANHPEVEGTMGQYSKSLGGEIYLVESFLDAQLLEINNPEEVSYVTQTTLSVDDTREIIAMLKSRFPLITGPRKDDICYATQNRQDSVKQLALEADLILVVGSKNSSNSNRLREIAERSGVESYLIDTFQDLNPQWFKGKSIIGITSGASAPENLVKEVIEAVKVDYKIEYPFSYDRVDEGVAFRLPKELRSIQ
ncbi:MAG: 4-hydroxy-3-methylbut-2-enyl diphosphate reductase [SAR86 cluster bacterium]|nr:4-hydroxy-3-methylbut-2-enyl diphosphate reductase [SAR86 cluster bacterium]